MASSYARVVGCCCIFGFKITADEAIPCAWRHQKRLGPHENDMASQRPKVPALDSRFIHNNRASAISPKVPPITVLAIILASVPILTGAAFKNEEKCGAFLETRVINGILATQGMFPWLVRLLVYVQESSPATCGGTIITKSHILTAAHCIMVKNKLVPKVEIIYGAVDTKSKYAIKTQAKSVALHPRFTSDEYHDDIAVLRVPKPFEFTENVRPACLDFNLGELAGKMVTVAGWGEPKKKYGPIDKLRYTKLKVVAQAECQRKLRRFHFNISSMMCAYMEDTDACQGDSGSAMMLRRGHRYHLVAVVSHGSGCAQDLPGIYTPVKAHEDWILKTLDDESAFKELGKE